MAHDLVIRNANVVDGTGGTPFAADLAIDGDTISAIGEETVASHSRHVVRKTASFLQA